MATRSNLFWNACAAALGLALCTVTTAYASLVAHSEAHVSNVQITSAGSLTWTYDPWLNIAAAGAFDDPSGWSQAYDDDPGATGQATADANTTYASAHALASSNLRTIDVSGDLNNPTNTIFALNAYGYGELYNTFQVTGSTPVQAVFSLDWNALLSGQSSSGEGYHADFAVQLLLSDGVTDWSQEAFNVLNGSGGPQSFSDSGTFSLTLTLQPNTLYAVDILAHPDLIPTVVPEPSTLVLLGSAGLLVCVYGFLKRTRAATQA